MCRYVDLSVVVSGFVSTRGNGDQIWMGFYRTWCWLYAQNSFPGQINLAMLSVCTDERSVVYYIQALTTRTLVEGNHHQKRKLKRIVFTNASICVMYASPIFRACDLLEENRDQ